MLVSWLHLVSVFNTFKFQRRYYRNRFAGSIFSADGYGDDSPGHLRLSFSNAEVGENRYHPNILLTPFFSAATCPQESHWHYGRSVGEVLLWWRSAVKWSSLITPSERVHAVHRQLVVFPCMFLITLYPVLRKCCVFLIWPNPLLPRCRRMDYAVEQLVKVCPCPANT